jgi:germination protein, Ger(x)C family
MKKLIFLIMPLLILSIVLCGCTHDFSRKEIDEINMVLILGIDYSNGEYTMNALYSGGGGADPEKGGASAQEKLSEGKGKTAYAALEDLKKKNKKSITLAQTGTFLIGEGAAKKGLLDSLDFLTREETIKMEGLIYVIKGMSAADFIKAGQENKQTIHEDLEAIKQKQKEYITRLDNSVVNILNDMKQSYSCVMIPYLLADKSGYQIEGYSVFDKLVLKDYLDRDTSAGVNFIKNLTKSYPVYLDKDKVNLLITYTKSKMNSKIQNNAITVNVKVNFETMVKEVLVKENIFTTERLDQLTKAQNQYVDKLLRKATDYSKTNGLDILNLARLVENQNYKEWKGIKANWSEQISKINYNFDIHSRVTKSFILGEE